ncbi:hypothetical protein ACOMHN_048373 [Nucella lapillus]
MQPTCGTSCTDQYNRSLNVDSGMNENIQSPALQNGQIWLRVASTDPYREAERDAFASLFEGHGEIPHHVMFKEVEAAVRAEDGAFPQLGEVHQSLCQSDIAEGPVGQELHCMQALAELLNVI